MIWLDVICRNPKCEPSDLEWQHVVILDPVAALAPTLDDALEGANRRIMATNVAPHERDTEMVGLLQSEALCRNEFIAAEVDGVCGLWGGEISPCPLSITTNIDLFTGKAASTGAIVYMAIHGGAGEDGTIQEMLEQKSVLYTGTEEHPQGNSHLYLCPPTLAQADKCVFYWKW